MKVRLLLFVLIAGLVCNVSRAQLLQWNTFGNTGSETTEPSVANDPNVSTSNLTLGAGVVAAANGNRFGGQGWSTSTLAVAVTGNDYIEFIVTPNTGYSFTPTSLVFTWDRSATGPANVTLRSSVDGFVSDLGTVSGIVNGANPLTVNTITISGLTNLATATTFRLYGYGATAAGGTGGFDINPAVNAVNVTLNGTTALTADKISANSGDWATAATWNPVGVPAPGETVMIQSGHTVYTSASITRSATTTVNGNFQLNNGGYATGTNFTYGTTGGLRFNSTANYGVANTDVYWPTASGPRNVTLVQGGITFNSASRTVAGNFIVGGTLGLNFTGGAQLTIDGNLYLNAGGYVASNSVIYGASSTLQYNSGGTYGRGYEWAANGVGTIGVTPGYPNNVTVNATTTLDYVNTLTPGVVGNKGMAGSLTLLGSMNMATGGVSTGGSLYVANDVYVNGALTLGSGVGDDLRMGGNLTIVAGPFNGNNRAIWFYKSSGTQTITTSSVLTIPYVVFDAVGNRTVTQAVGTTVNITAPLGGNAISFGSAADVWSIGNSTLSIGTAGVANAISGPGTFSGAATSTFTLLGTGSIGTVNFTTGSQNLGTFTVNRTAAAVACSLGTPLTVNASLALTNGHIDLGNNTLTLAAAAAISGGSANSYVIADVGYGASSALRKGFTGASTFAFPVGDRAASADGSQYSPLTVVTAAGTYSGAFASVSVDDVKHPNFDAASEYITRYWNIATSGTIPANFTANGTYLDADVNAPAQEANYIGNKWNGTTWSNGGSPVNAPTNETNTVPCTSGATNHVTAGRRDPDINVYGGVTVVNNASGWTYDFGSVLVGNTNAVTFTIQNIGQQALNVSLPSTSPVAPYIYTTPYTAGNVAGPSGTKTFVVTFTPTAGGTFTGSIVIPSTDPDEPSYTVNFTGVGVVPAPEINIRGNSITIAPGNTPSGLDNTLWAGQTIATTSAAKTFEIQNTGTATLTLTGSYVTLGGANPGDWTIATMPSNSIAAASNSTFTVTFTPTAAGTRTATLTVYSNDSDEPTYTWNIQGSGICGAATNTITPTSGPEGTEITVNAAVNNLTGATATIGGVAATVIPVSATQIKVIVPANAATGYLVTTNASGCTASNYFTVYDKTIASCQGGITRSQLFISEVTDHGSGSHSYVEIWNATGAAVNLLNYTVRIHNNGAVAPTSTITLPSFSLANNSGYIVAFGGVDATSNPGGHTPNFTSAVSGVNNDDNIRLYNAGGTWVDLWGDTTGAVFTPASAGYYYRRKNVGITAPSTTWNPNDWVAAAPVDYTDIGLYDYSPGTPPTVTQDPTYTPSCKNISMTVAGTEGFVGGNALAYQWYAVAPNTANWTALSNAGVYSGVTTATLNISSIVGLDGYQFYCQIRENGATCYTATNAVKINEAITVTWDGTSWSPSPPTINSIAVINGPYNTGTNGNIDACSLVINSPNALTVTPNAYVNIQNDLTVNTGGSLQVQDDGSLVMVDDNGVVTNNGTTQISRTTSPYNKYDYTYWSSPVTGATIGATFPTWRTDYAFQFVTANFADISPADGFDDNQNAWVYTPTSTVMANGKGYAIMAPTTGTFPTTNTVTFSGPVNNGVINILLAASGNGASNTDDFNLIGNPYPSAIYANDFINANPNFSGTLYFWTHRTGISPSNPGPDANNFITADYAMYNLSGGTSSGTGSPVPSGYVASGEGFFVEASAYTNVVFNNAMRSKTYNNSQFYRPATANAHFEGESASSDKDRLWLNLESADGLFSQQLIAYFDNTTLDFDRGYDGLVSSSSNTLSFYSFIGDEKYRIQARPPFDISDVVPLGYKSTLAGTYFIAIGNKEGQLDYADTNIYLEDKSLGIIHDLKQAPYNFTTAVGTFNDRFVLRYTNSALGNEDIDTLENSIAVAVSEAQINVKSYAAPIESVAVYDILGRRLFSKDDVNANEFSVADVTTNEQALIVRIKLENGILVNRKIVF